MKMIGSVELPPEAFLSVLSMEELEKEDIVKRSVDQNTGIILYGLTKKGAELKPVFDQVHNWADKWAQGIDIK